MPKSKKTPRAPKPPYRRKPPQPGPDAAALLAALDASHPEIGHPIVPAHFELRDDGSIAAPEGRALRVPNREDSTEQSGTRVTRPSENAPPQLAFSDPARQLWLYHGNCLELLDAIAAKHPEGRFDAIFADPPYFLSNGGISCHAGKMVKVDKGDWDKSQGAEVNHEFNREWLRRCQRVLKPNGTIWVTGTHHVIFSIGYAMQQLGFKILNDIAWEKPNPPPNLSCRYFTHSTETVLWAAKSEKSKHVFNYQEMRKVTGKQMKTVWRDVPPQGARSTEQGDNLPDNSAGKLPSATGRLPVPPGALDPIWTMTAPGNDEKEFGKHPTQKPVALVERCLLASTNPGDLVLDPFLGGGTTAVAALRLKRGCVGVEADEIHLALAIKRGDREIIEIWLREYRVRVEITIVGRAELLLRHRAEAAQQRGPTNLQNDLDLFSDSINGSRCMADVPQIPTERIYHETKFVFLSCAQVERGAVVHTTVDVSLQEAWAKTPTGKKRETTHIVRCETEIFRIKP